MIRLPKGEGWVCCWSRTYKQSYFFNTLTQESCWSGEREGSEGGEGVEVQQCGGSRPLQSPLKRARTEICGEPARVKVAIIVPFRDLHEEQQREKHLGRFVPYMSKFMEGSDATIYIVEQSDDGQKFNRGKLLNVGFRIAQGDGCNSFILHDVDLLPSSELAPWYTSYPKVPVHIARRWDRYSSNNEKYDYFGGIVAINAADFEGIVYTDVKMNGAEVLCPKMLTGHI